MSELFRDGGIRFARSLLLPTLSCHHKEELVFKTRFLALYLLLAFKLLKVEKVYVFEFLI
jgi:hypothetical protein